VLGGERRAGCGQQGAKKRAARELQAHTSGQYAKPAPMGEAYTGT
jgi:hypothetical protein